MDMLEQQIHFAAAVELPRFPKLKFSETNTLEEQINHIQGEVNEVKGAFHLPGVMHVAEEIGDVMVSAMTAMTIIQREYGIDPAVILHLVHQKNRSRGYEL